MPFEIPENLHPDCAPVAWLLGTWRGNGHGDYPTIDAFQFGQECIFTHDGRPFFHYMSRAWIVDDAGEKATRHEQGGDEADQQLLHGISPVLGFRTIQETLSNHTPSG